MANLTARIIAIILFMTVFAGLIIVTQQTAGEYEVDLDPTYFNGTTNSTEGLDATYDIGKTMSGDVETGAVSQSTLDAVFSSGFNSLRQITKTIGYVKSTITNIVYLLHIPIFIFNAVMAILLFAIAIAVIYAILGRT